MATLMTARWSSALTNERIRSWGFRSGGSIVDQGLTSLAGFLISFVLARWLPSESYGVFAVVYATLLFVFGFHSVLLLEPVSVFGPAEYSGKIESYFIEQIKIHVIVASSLSGLVLLACAVMSRFGISSELMLAFAGSAAAMPFLFLAWLVRRMCYVVHSPSRAMHGSIAYLATMIAGVFGLRAAGWLNPFTAFLLLGAASIPAVSVMSRSLGLWQGMAERITWGEVWRQNWRYGRWLIASTALFSVATQAQTYVAAAFAGLGAAGILRAAQIPALVMTQVVTAAGLLVLPAMASDFGRGRLDLLQRKAQITTMLVSGVAALYALALGLWPGRIERLLYAGKYGAHANLIPILALGPVCMGFAIGYGMALRACQKPHYDLIANSVAAPVGLISALILIRVWGIEGAALSLVAASAAYGGTFYVLFRMEQRRIGDRAVVQH